MINKAKKIYLSLLISITAVVFFTLPFWLTAEEVYVYSSKALNSHQEQYLKELENLGCKIKKQASNSNVDKNITLYFLSIDEANQIQYSKSKYNFIYIEEYNSITLDRLRGYSIILTPHKNIYEHYVRSNIKTALLDIKNPIKSALKFKQILDWLKNN